MSVPSGTIVSVHSEAVRGHALTLLSEGHTLTCVALQTSVHTSTLRRWRSAAATQPQLLTACDPALLDTPEYAALLGFYLGDGCVSPARGSFVLRVACDRRLPGIIADVTNVMAHVSGSTPCHVAAPGVTVVKAQWKHWPCVLPQHGTGPKHGRDVSLVPWQSPLVAHWNSHLLRGLFHSDGSRFVNTVRSSKRVYRYPRWQFTNYSAQILELCTTSLDREGIAWRRSGQHTVYISRREAVERLDGLIGMKR